jgi:hypothetical protein
MQSSSVDPACVGTVSLGRLDTELRGSHVLLERL